jgi:hypothetical protein
MSGSASKLAVRLLCLPVVHFGELFFWHCGIEGRDLHRGLKESGRAANKFTRELDTETLATICSFT